MKLLAATILTIAILSTLAFTFPPRESCSCAANDGSCNVSGSCPQGCLAFCPSGKCRVYCVSSTGGSREEVDFSQQVTLRLAGSDSRKVASELARLTGAQVVFNPRRPDATFNLDAKNMPLWDILDILSAEGSIQIGREEFSNLKALRLALLSGESMAVCFSNITAKRMAEELSFLTGVDVHVPASDAKITIDYSGKGVTFAEMLAQMSESSGARFTTR